MRKLIIFALVGFLAQLIDGSLGMAYGVSTSTLLLTFGIAPAMASASVHLSEIVTTAVSGVSHIKFGNVDKKALFRLIIPGAIGGFIGACFLSSLPGDVVKPFISLFLMLLGLYILARFLFMSKENKQKKFLELSRKQAIPLGLIAGFADATGGGGWGPITTPILMLKKGVEARKVIGTVDTSEFVIAVATTIGFLISLGWEAVNWYWVIALMIGGIFAAPIAAWLVQKLPNYILGVVVGGFIVIINAYNVLSEWVVQDKFIPLIYGIIVAGWFLAIFISIKRKNRT
ncbi:sulfite exporter TauE/SafE family protein [Bacillus thuringiensis]